MIEGGMNCLRRSFRNPEGKAIVAKLACLRSFRTYPLCKMDAYSWAGSTKSQDRYSWLEGGLDGEQPIARLDSVMVATYWITRCIRPAICLCGTPSNVAGALAAAYRGPAGPAALQGLGSFRTGLTC